MSSAVRALILINADKHAGKWVPLLWLSGRLCMTPDQIKVDADYLTACGLLQHDGVDAYGVQITDPAATTRLSTAAANAALSPSMKGQP